MVRFRVATLPRSIALVAVLFGTLLASVMPTQGAAKPPPLTRPPAAMVTLFTQAANAYGQDPALMAATYFYVYRSWDGPKKCYVKQWGCWPAIATKGDTQTNPYYLKGHKDIRAFRDGALATGLFFSTQDQRGYTDPTEKLSQLYLGIDKIPSSLQWYSGYVDAVQGTKTLYQGHDGNGGLKKLMGKKTV